MPAGAHPRAAVASFVCVVCVVCVFISALLAAVASPAAAHNGVGAAFKGPAGRYTVYAYDGYRLPNGLLEYRLVLLDTATGEPADNVTTTITARPVGAVTPARSAQVTVMANVVLYDLPNPYPRDWTVTVSLAGPLGHGRAQFPMHGQAPYVPAAVRRSGGSAPWLPIGIGVGAAVVAGAAFLMLRRRRRTPGVDLAA